VPCSLEEYLKTPAATIPRVIKQETVGRYWVSTVFLPINHGFKGLTRDLWFETMIFDNESTHEIELDGQMETFRDDVYQERYSTLEEARRGHAVAVEHARRLMAEAL